MAHPFGAGRVLGRSFRIWGRNIVKFTILYAIVYLPLVAYGILAFPRAGPRAAGYALYIVVLVLGYFLLWFIAPLALIHGVLQELRGEHARFGDCLRVYLTRLSPAIGVGLAVGFFALLTAIPGFAIFGPSILALFPPTLVASVYFVAIPVAAAERSGVGAALQRSAGLTKGSRASIFAIVLVPLALWFVPKLIVRVGPSGGPLNEWVDLLLFLVCGGYGAVVTSVAYHDLRVAREGIGVDDLVRVFA